MNGRTENDLQIEKKIEKRLENQDETLKEFYSWMNGKSVLTQEKYIYYVIDFIDYCKGKMEVDHIGREDYNKITLAILDEYIKGLNKSKRNSNGRNGTSIIVTRICAISTFFKFLKTRGIVDSNICEYVDRPKVRQEDHITFLTKEEIKELMDNIERGVGTARSIEYSKKYKTRDRLICLLPIITGMRVSALRNINIEDVDMKNMTVSVVEKENKRRVFQLPEAACREMAIWIREREKIFKNVKCETTALFVGLYRDECKRLTTGAINSLIKKYSSTIHKKITAHKLRDTFATNLYNETSDIFLVSEMLGHQNPETTKKYVRASDQQKKGAVKIMADIIY